MANKKKATPSPADEKIYNGTFTYTDLNGKEVEVKYRDYISLQDMGACVHSIVGNVVDDELGYFPYLYDYAFYEQLLKLYTDFDISIGTEEFTRILYKTDIIEKFEMAVFNPQIEAITTSVDDMIEFRKQKYKIDSEIDNMWIAGNDLLLKISGIVDSLDVETTKKAIENLSKIDVSNITEKGLLSAMLEFGGVGKGKDNKPKKSRSSKKGVKNNVVELQLPLQQAMDGSEIPE